MSTVVLPALAQQAVSSLLCLTAALMNHLNTDLNTVQTTDCLHNAVMFVLSALHSVSHVMSEHSSSSIVIPAPSHPMHCAR